MLAMLAMLAENLWIEVLDLTSGLKIELGVRHAFGPLARRIYRNALFAGKSLNPPHSLTESRHGTLLRLPQNLAHRCRGRATAAF